jgi:hypothetical protein
MKTCSEIQLYRRERTRELGLRMALVASRTNVLRLVLWQGLALARIGIGIGALTSVFTTRLITGTLFRVAPLDRSVFLTVTLVLLFVSMTAALVPTLRAANVDPYAHASGAVTEVIETLAQRCRSSISANCVACSKSGLSVQNPKFWVWVYPS